MTSLDMGVLIDSDIHEARASGELVVEPFDPGLVRPAAVSLRLGTPAAVLRSAGPVDVADARTHPDLVSRDPDADGRLRLDPGEVMLAPTLERIALAPSLTGLIDGTSDYARLGLSIVLCHQVSPGYGHDVDGGAILTLEIVSRLAHPVYLRPGARIANLLLFRCRPATNPYHDMPANYSRDTQVRASRLAETYVG